MKRTEKLQLLLNDHELQAIEDWRFENRIPTRAAAIRELIRRGLQAQDQSAPAALAPTTQYSVVE